MAGEKMKGKFLKLLILMVFICLPVFLTSGCSFGTLPEPSITEATKIYDVHNNLITTLYKENRIQVSINEIPKITQQAFVAVEDARFYKHYGVDPIRIIGAAYKDIKAGELAEGGSTITQQTVKNLYLSREKTFSRKLTEAWYAILLERKYTKDEILAMYLNQVYFGQGAYGIEVAAKTYFDKSASQLDLAESALLAGLLKAPNSYNPYQNWEGAKKRQKIVLDRMVEVKYITAEQAKEAEDEKLILKSGITKANEAPYVVSEVIKYVTDKYEDGAQMLYSGGLSIHTGIDLNMQKAAASALEKQLESKSKTLDGALVAVDPSTGQIRAMVGGKDYATSKFNRATQAKRQPGSAFKPFLYTAAIDNGKTQASTITCEPVSYPQDNGTTYSPTDYGSTPYHNKPFTLKKALSISDNIVAVKLNSELGPGLLVDYANKMGIKSKLRAYLSLALGTSEVTPLEITGAYATLASGGIQIDPYLITKITDSKGGILEEIRPVRKRVISSQTAYLVTDMMTAVLAPGGTASSLSPIIGRTAAGKTGTTQNYQDAWFVGFTPQLAAGVYIGHDDPKKTVGIPGGQISGPIWANFMAEALKDVPDEGFPVPDNIVTVDVCSDTGLLATAYSPETIKASFVAGTEPTEYCPVHPDPYAPYNQPNQDNLNNNENGNQGPGQGNNTIPRLRQRFFDWFSGFGQ